MPVVETFASEATQAEAITGVRSGLELGAVIASVFSRDRDGSILWAILAGILGWIWVIYFALTREPIDMIGPEPPVDVTRRD